MGEVYMLTTCYVKFRGVQKGGPATNSLQNRPFQKFLARGDLDQWGVAGVFVYELDESDRVGRAGVHA